MPSSQQFSGFNPIYFNPIHVSKLNPIYFNPIYQPTRAGPSSHRAQLPVQNHTSGVLQFAETTQQETHIQPPTNSSGDGDVVMEDSDSSEPEDQDVIMSDTPSTDSGDWDPTEVTPSTTPMNPGPNPAAADTDNNGTDMMNIDTPDYQPSNSPQTPPTWAPFNQTISMILSSPYTHGHPVLYSLDVEREVDENGDLLMESA